ncbi:MAG: ArsA-related P-loop ATPase [Acidimicrobiia bacterium]
MELAELCSSSRVIIVAGKGGVGKTTVAAALATAAARAGRSALLVELEGKSGLAATFGRPSLEDREFEPLPGVKVLPIAPDEALMEYLDDHGLGRLSRRLTSTGAIDMVSTAVPGMKDILVLGKVKALQRAGVADVIVVDGPAAGHAVTFLLSPKGLLDAVRVGPVLTQAMEVTEMLTDADRARVMLVTLPEETPVNETVDTARVLIGSAGLSLAPLVVNGLYADRSLDPEPEGIRAAAAAPGVDVPDSELEHLVLAAEFHTRRRALQVAQLERLEATLALPQVRLPFLFTAELGPTELVVLAEAVTEGLEAVATTP